MNILDICQKRRYHKRVKGREQMARKPKCRRICHFPETMGFVPLRAGETIEPIILTVDEYETIRLIDKEGLSQEQCSLQMQVARTTTQKIYEAARKKLAVALVEGLPLHIRGGAFRVCDGREATCYKQTCAKQYGTIKGEDSMRIAVTYENGQIFQHFGHTQQFKVYEVTGGKVVSSQVVDTCGSGHGALAGVLQGLQADILICGGIGGGAQMALASAGIRLYGGVSGNADQAVEALLNGVLEFNPNVRCSHHDHEHGEEHQCGDHGCGSHSCGHH